MGAAFRETLGRFKVLARLGAGGMAEVLLAREPRPNGESRLLVVKRLLPHLQDEREQVQMFVDEASLAQHIDHPNVVRTYGFEEVDGLPVLLMEYLEGESASLLWKRLPEIGIEPMMAAWIVAAAARGLHAAHEATDEEGTPLNVVHRDVSPHNVLITYNGEVKLLDFGVARASGRDNKTQSGVIKGKPGYISPEQLLGPSVDRRADIFGLGIVLWELSTGERLFQRAHQLAVVQAVCHGEIPPPTSLVDDYPPELEKIVLRALSRKREDRYQTAEELHLALSEVLAQGDWAVDGQSHMGLLMLQQFGARRDEKRALIERASLPVPSAEAVRRVETDDTQDFELATDEEALGGTVVPSVKDGPSRRILAMVLGALFLAIGAVAWAGLQSNNSVQNGATGTNRPESPLPPTAEPPRAPELPMEPAQPPPAAVVADPPPTTTGGSNDNQVDPAGDPPIDRHADPRPGVSELDDEVPPEETVELRVSGHEGAIAEIGDERCTLPCALRVNKATAPVDLAVRARGHRTYRRRVVPNEDQQLRVTLRRRARTPPDMTPSMFQPFD